MDSLLEYLITAFLSFSLSAIFTPFVRTIAIKYDYVARPRDDRWNQKTTGLLGGISIFVSFMLAWGFSAFYAGSFHEFIRPLLPAALCGTAVFILGLADDIWDINPQYKLIGQVIAASVLVFFGFQFSWFESRTANLVISIFWIVGITNAFNLLDNMDGLSAGIAAISGFFLMIWIFWTLGYPHKIMPELIMLSAYIGAILGFLIYNFNPASIFMGDAGSLFIGFMIASLTIMEGPEKVQGSPFFHQISVVLIPCLILFVPILDTTFVSFMRKLFSRSVFQGGKDHSSHRMVAVGFSERKAVIILYLFAVISGMIALCVYPLKVGISVVMVVFFLICVLLFWIYLANVKVYDEAPRAMGKHNGFLYPVLMEAGYGRTLFSVLLDLVLITIVYYTAYLLRFEYDLGPNFNFFLKSLPILFASQIFCFYIFGVYQRMWWGSRLGDLSVYFKGVTSGTVLAMLILLFVYRFQSFSRAVFVIYWGLMMVCVSFSRFFFRILDERVSRINQNGKPTLIYGAGVGGLMVVREIETNGLLGLSIIGFLDDSPTKKGKTIHGYPVLGGADQLEEILRKHHIEEIIVSFKINGAEKKKEIKKMCVGKGLDISVSQMHLTISP
jgi:UDP-GlcNAc:undecaprenyl-phosphate GlcNAc-1-phosphate transferase